jgi:pantoate--beta-alanine ligase
MNVLKTVAEAQAVCRSLKREGKCLGLVPTMGALHEGHLALVRAARARSQVVAVSVFVNPLQFGPQEDFSRYPRNFERDCQLLEAEKVDLIFAPPVDEMYPQHSQPGTHGKKSGSLGTATFVEVPGLGEKLEGKTRPGHFRGVTTVVSKLFHIVDPDLAFFGQKDAQQVAIICRMVRDLNFPLQVVVCPTVRESDGVAMSSRNAYLDPAHRQVASVLYRALMRVQALAEGGECCAATLAEAGRQVIREEPLARLDYFEIVHPETFDPVLNVAAGAVVLTAVYFGHTRLIDNVLLHGVASAQKPV